MSDPGKRQADSSTFDWESHLAARAKGINPSIIREILKLTVRPDVISFAGGLPAPELFPIKEFDEACHHILETEGEIALQYSLSEGYMPLRQFLADSMSQYMNKIEADNILIVNGSQQGLELIGKIFIDPGTKIVCSRPTYLGALQAWTSYQARYISVPLDEQGMCVDEIPALLQSGDSPRIVYVLPNFHNPAGTTLPLERRERLVEIAREYDLIIVEDDPYRELRYEGEDIETGRRSPHGNIRADGCEPDLPERYPAETRQAVGRSLPQPPKRDARCVGGALAEGSVMDFAAWRSVPVGASSGIDQHAGFPGDRRCRESRLRAGFRVLSLRKGRGTRHAPEFLERFRGDDQRRNLQAGARDEGQHLGRVDFRGIPPNAPGRFKDLKDSGLIRVQSSGKLAGLFPFD
ncbi:MAG: PLP-dependent aminotransferase family protein [Anaerolineales bacterium]